MQVSPPINVSPSERLLIKSELDTDPQGIGYKRADGNWKSTQEIAALLSSKPMISNPNPQGTVPKPLDKNEFLPILLPFISNISDAALIRVSEAIDADDRAAVQLWLTIALARAWIDQTAHDTLATKLAETIPDPDWKATIPGKSPLERVIGRPAGISPQEVGAILALTV